MIKKIPVGILGATGMVGQKLVNALTHHPLFNLTIVAASHRSASKHYKDAIKDNPHNLPQSILNLKILDIVNDLNLIADNVDLVFSAFNSEGPEIQRIENKYAQHDIAVISNNSAHRWTKDVPVIIPEINFHHLEIINLQRKNRGWEKGLIVTKPNCSVQGYALALHPLLKFGPKDIVISTYQALSGAGKTLNTWPEMTDNIIPFIKGEEKKVEQEPLKIWGKIKKNVIIPDKKIRISANCVRVPVSDGHLATVHVRFATKPTRKDIINAWKNYRSPLANFHLPSNPRKCITYFTQEDRPQTKLDRNLEKGMGVSVGRLREDNIFDWKFVCLVHNTIRGAAGGAILTAELLVKQGYLIKTKN